MNKEEAEMNIGLKCFATLAEADKCDYKGSTSKPFRMDLLFATC